MPDTAHPRTHFLALLTCVSAEEGGRHVPMPSGYRPTLVFSSYGGMFRAILNFTEAENVYPGDTVTAEVTLLDPEALQGKVYEGQDFEFFEGESRVGTGTIKKMLSM